MKKSYHFLCISHIQSKHRADNHLDVFDKRIVTEVVTIQSNLVGKNHIVVIPNSKFLIGHLICINVNMMFSYKFPNVTQHFIFKPIL